MNRPLHEPLYRFPKPGNEDVALLSLLVLAMTILLLGRGLSNPEGMLALAVQIGLLVRINYVHRKAKKQREKKDNL